MDLTNVEFAELFQVVPAIMPVDMQAGANAGDWVNMKLYPMCTVIVMAAIGTAGDDITVTFLQATDVAGTGSKNLATVDRVYRKEGATDINAVGTYTLDEQAAAATWTNTTNAENELLLVATVRARDLDIANDFDCMSISIADVGSNAQLGAALYVLYPGMYGAGATLPSAIA